MATKKPRINVTVSVSQYQLLQELSDVGGESMSAIVAGLVTAVEPAFVKTLRLMRAATEAPEEVRRRLREVAEDAGEELEPVLEDANAAYAAAMERLDAVTQEHLDPHGGNHGGQKPSPSPLSTTNQP